MVENCYSADRGRNSIDPVVLFKAVLVQHLYGIPSLRQTMRDIDMNVAYRWFWGYNFSEPIPHFATVSHAFAQRYDSKVAEDVFRWILGEAERAGYLEPETVFLDGTHIKASANINKKIKKAVPEAARRYSEALMAEVNADREDHGKNPFDDTPKSPKIKEKVISKTDPESGLFHKGDHKLCFAYEAHTACDANGFVLDVEVTPGNVHDSVAFDTLYRKLIQRFPNLKTIVADVAFKTPWICKQIFDDGRVLSTAYKRPRTMKGGHEWWKLHAEIRGAVPAAKREN